MKRCQKKTNIIIVLLMSLLSMAVLVSADEQTFSDTISTYQEDHSISSVQKGRTSSFYGVWYAATKSYDEAQRFVARGKSYGFNAQMFVSTDWSNLNSSKWYVTTAGIYSSYSSAKSILPKVKRWFSDAYVKYSGYYKGSTKPGPTVLTSLTSTSKGTFTAWWRSVSGVDGYQIRYSTSSSFANKKTASIAYGKRSYTRKDVKAGTRYYVGVRTYRILNGKKIYSNWSGTKTVIIAKEYRTRSVIIKDAYAKIIKKYLGKSPIQIAIHDINQDGTPELFVTVSNYENPELKTGNYPNYGGYYDVYTYSNKAVFAGGLHCYYLKYHGNQICNTSIDLYDFIYQLRNNKLYFTKGNYYPRLGESDPSYPAYYQFRRYIINTFKPVEFSQNIYTQEAVVGYLNQKIK